MFRKFNGEVEENIAEAIDFLFSITQSIQFDKFEFKVSSMAIYSTMENVMRIEGSEDTKNLLKVCLQDIQAIMGSTFHILETLFHLYDALHECNRPFE